ncbi:TlpA family protein disulfide reductase [Geoalkalibacter halelectricus]|uniref:TlpA family protein disulfide reductase n=1 Tax=Geoalkalibacter halelectricus TaxID=2847045 RepID=UPI00266F2DB5|nr:TlpA disulfide reductase family protein [Geoalkalibacter halelectricus]MDO3378347.1 TlpA family protein disulfide reductase [Geoalkalibacter halelectricus]
MKKVVLRALAVLVLLLVVSLPAAALERGDQAPEFTLKNLDGREVSLSDYRGRIVLLKLATTWCPTCKQQTDDILRAADLLVEHDVVVLEVFVQDSERMVRRYLRNKTFPMTFEALMDTGQAHRAYNVYLIPRMLVLDREHRVYHDGGQLFEEDLRRLVGEVAALEPAP